jgi:hypothetical protein
MQRFASLAWILVAMSFATVAWSTRQWNLDAIFYSAVAHRWAGATPEQAHQKTYEEARAIASPEGYRDLTTISPYRQGLASNPGQLESQFPLYVNKPLFVGALSLGARVGIGPFWLSYFFSALAWGVLVALLMHEVKGWARVAIAVAFLSPPLLEGAQLSSPDTLAALLTCIGFLRLKGEAPRWQPWVFFALASLTRPDAALLCGALLVWRDRRKGLAPAAALIVLTMIVSRALGGVSWSALFVHSFQHRLTSPEEMAGAHVSLGDYFTNLVNVVHYPQTLHPSAVLLFVALSLAALRRTDRRELHAAIWSAGLIRMLAVPMLVDRYFLPHYALVLWACLAERDDQ